MKTTKRQVTEETLLEAKRLKEAHRRYKQSNKFATQEWLAGQLGFGTQGAVSQYLNGTIPLNLKTALKFCNLLNVPVAEISQRLADELFDIKLGQINQAVEQTQTVQLPAAGSSSVKIPVLSAVASMGPGESLHYEGDQIIEFLPISKQWLSENLSSEPKNLRVITGAGDSMKPTFSHGDLLLVDCSKKTIDIDGVYAMSAHSRLFIKRVRQRLDGTFEVSSDNPTVKTVDVLNGDHEVVIHGRVVWAWNGARL